MGELQSHEYQPNELSLYRDKKRLENASELPYEEVKSLDIEYRLLERDEWHFLSERQRDEVKKILGRTLIELWYRNRQMKDFEEQLAVDDTLSVDQLPQVA